MSLEDLESDVTRNAEEFAAQAIPFASFDDVKKYIDSTIYPLFQNVVEEMMVMDDDISTMVEKSDDVLQPETAGIFAAVVQQCRGLCKVLSTRLRPGNPDDKKLALRMKNILTLCQKAEETLLEITVAPTPESEEIDEPAGTAEMPDLPDAANTNEGGADAGV